MTDQLLYAYERDYLQAMGRELRVNRHRLAKLRQHGLHVVLSQPSAASRNRYRALVNHMMKWGEEQGIVTAGFRPLKLERSLGPRTRRMTHDEETDLLSVMDDTLLRETFIAALDTGLRKSTLLALTFRMWDGETLRIPAHLTKQRQVQVIPLTKRLNAIIKHRWVGLQSGDAPIFPIPRARLDLAWAAAKHEAGVKDLHWHDLRGEFASRLDEAGVPVSVTSKLLGHSSLAMTQIYLRPRVEQFRDAIDKLGV